MTADKKILAAFCLCLASFSAADAAGTEMIPAEEVRFNTVPVSWKWVSDTEVAFSYDGTFSDSLAFMYDARTGCRKDGISCPDRYPDFPVHPEGAVNMTYSPDSSRIAYTRAGNLYVMDLESGAEIRLTDDGNDLILNGYASWVYYEEIFGRSTDYKAFWWSPDGNRIGFYRFDNTQVPLFPIYSPFGQNGSLRSTRYPKAGERNPEVRIGIADVSGLFVRPDGNGHEDADAVKPEIVWADFNPEDDQYFGTPFWGPDSRGFYVSRMPRRQNVLDLYRVDVSDGSKSLIYHEEYDTWLDWIDGIVFTDKGLYMARSFETGWEQIYFLSYDGKTLERLTGGRNWNISILRVDERKGDVYFTANRDAAVRQSLYKVNVKGEVRALVNPVYDVRDVCFSGDGRYFAASYSNSVTPVRVAVFETSRYVAPSEMRTSDTGLDIVSVTGKFCREHIVGDMAYEGFSVSDHALPEIVYITVPDGFTIPASIVYPEDFDPAEKYPVHMDIYGGPDTPMVRDRWTTPSESSRWWPENGIIQITADCRASGHNGRAGLDMVYGRLTVNEVKDFISWAEWLKSLPYVDGDRIGVEGFSFGGTMTAMLLMQAPEYFHYGIAGGGVYDWALYDSHYTERYMDTPQNNPEGYRQACVLEYADMYPAGYGDDSGDGIEPVMLKLTHGTGDDNVHFQNTLQLIDVLQKNGRKFDFMIYPDGMHGYRGAQQEHFKAANREFWLRYLKPGK